MTVSYLYSFEFPNGKKYIGITNNFERRWADHSKRSANHLVARAIRAYGTQHVLKRILCIGSHEYIASLEIAAIAAFNTTDRRYGYNLTAGGETSPSKSPAVARKISNAKLGHVVTDETRSKLREATLRQFTKEEREAARARSLAQFSTEEARGKLSAACRSAWVGREEEQRLKAIAHANKPGVREKLSEWSRAYNSTAEAKQKNRERMGLKWADPEWRAKIIAAQKAGRAAKKAKG